MVERREKGGERGEPNEKHGKQTQPLGSGMGTEDLGPHRRAFPRVHTPGYAWSGERGGRYSR